MSNVCVCGQYGKEVGEREKQESLDSNVAIMNTSTSYTYQIAEAFILMKILLLPLLRYGLWRYHCTYCGHLLFTRTPPKLQ